MNDDKRFEEEEEEENRPRIKVTDRRSFDRHGNIKDVDAAAAADVVAEDVPPPTTDDLPPSPIADADTASPPDSTEADEPVETAAADVTAAIDTHAADETDGANDIQAPHPGFADLPRDFAAFVEGMYMEAMLYMGAIPDPRSGETMVDTELAKYKIDLLVMIKEKTVGNLTPEESKQLEEVLYQLRTVYLQTTKTTNF